MKVLRKISLLAIMLLTFGVIGAMAQVSVTATAGTPGPTVYTTLGGAGGAFAAINAGTHQGAITIDITANVTETAAAVLNSSGAGAASYTSILIRPTADGVTIAGPTISGRGLIELNGADNVTIDGDNPNTAGTSRNLTITNTAAAATTYTSVIRVALATTIVTSADNNIFRNLILNGSATARNTSSTTSTTSSENTTYGILASSGASTTSATTAPSAVTSISALIASGATAANLTIGNNAVTNASRGVAIQGSSTTVFPGLVISGNTIGNATTGATSGVYALGILAQGSANAVISTNTVYVEGFIPSAASNQGIAIGTLSTAITGATIERNQVNRVKSNSTTGYNAYGINLGGGSNHIVRNNFVSGVINVPNATNDTQFGAFGIRLAAGTGHFVYHNSVNMYGNLTGSTGAGFSAAFLITTTGITGVDARNNIFANTQTETGAATPANSSFVSVFLPSGATAAFNLTLNNNAYYQGSAVNNGIGQVGVTAGTGFYTAANFDPTATTPATNFRAYTSTLSAAGTNDNASFATAAAAPFTSNTDLHIPAGTSTRLESGGATVGVTNDIDNETRPNGVAPDIGADEFVGTAPVANDISATAIVTPANGAVLVTGSTTTPQASFTNVGTAAQTNVQVTFTITGPGGYSYTDTQTIATIAANQTVTVTFAAAPAIATAGTYTTTATVITADSNAANNTVSASFSAIAPVPGGTVNVGTGETYTSLTNAGGLFAALNAAGATGNITINLTSDLTGETGSNSLGQLAAGITVTIKPSGAARTITSTPGATTLLGFIGTDNVTIDGSLNGGSDQSLTLTLANTTSSGTVTVFVGSQGTGAGATNFTLKNTIVNGGSASPAGTLTTFGIFVGDQTGAAAGADNDNLTIQNNLIQRALIGIQAIGVAATGIDDNMLITDNTLGGTAATDFLGRVGINVSAVNNSTISVNTVRNMLSTGAADVQGIIVGAGSTNTRVSRNNVTNLEASNAGGYGSTGISIGTGAAASNITVDNNFVSDIRGTSYLTTILTDTNAGIRVITSGTGGVNIYYNSVNMFGTYAGFNGATITSGLLVVTGVTGLDVRDNTFVNIFNNTTVTTDKNYAIYSQAPNTAFATINYNDYFVGGGQGVLAAINSTDATTLAALQTATGQDANSLNADPLFVSPTDLHVQAGSPLIDAGTVVPVTIDFDGRTRGVSRGVGNTDIGADEFTAPTAASATISGRVRIGRGNGIRNVTVTLTGGNLEQPVTVVTGVNGRYEFPDVPAGQTYFIEVSARRYTFNQTTRVVSLTGDIDSIDFVGESIGLKSGGSMFDQ